MNSKISNSIHWNQKIAVVLSFLIGALSVFAGSKVLFGIDSKEYFVLTWLVIYNVVFGVISIIAAFLLWKKKPYSKRLVIFILSMHLLVFIFLKFFSATVAIESVSAMQFRTIIWIFISILSIIIPIYKHKYQK